MIKNGKNLIFEKLLAIFPGRLAEEIRQLCRGRREGIESIREIRVRAGGRASLRLGNLYFSLFCSVTADEISRLVEQISGGGIYAHRDKISAGYLPLFDGVRVGVCGSARYEEGSLVGVENISSLVFRIPGNKCDIEAELLSAFRQASAGMLIYSPPGGGKTTALRSLAHSLGSGRAPLRVCVVDEREEFVAEDYSECEVDILKGYKRRNGIEIATRTMSPDVIIIDEIGCDDAAAIADAVRSGIPVVATAHAGSLIELKSKSLLRPLYDVGAFDVFAGISEKGGVHILTVNKDE